LADSSATIATRRSCSTQLPSRPTPPPCPPAQPRPNTGRSGAPGRLAAHTYSDHQHNPHAQYALDEYASPPVALSRLLWITAGKVSIRTYAVECVIRWQNVSSTITDSRAEAVTPDDQGQGVASVNAHVRGQGSSDRWTRWVLEVGLCGLAGLDTCVPWPWTRPAGPGYLISLKAAWANGRQSRQG
jgi:hypothetical protein